MPVQHQPVLRNLCPPSILCLVCVPKQRSTVTQKKFKLSDIFIDDGDDDDEKDDDGGGF